MSFPFEGKGLYSIGAIASIVIKMGTTTIQVDSKVRDILKAFGRKGETYNDIIVRLIKRAGYRDYMKECYEILDHEKDWKSLDEL